MDGRAAAAPRLAPQFGSSSVNAEDERPAKRARRQPEADEDMLQDEAADIDMNMLASSLPPPPAAAAAAAGETGDEAMSLGVGTQQPEEQRQQYQSFVWYTPPSTRHPSVYGQRPPEIQAVFDQAGRRFVSAAVRSASLTIAARPPPLIRPVSGLASAGPDSPLPSPATALLHALHSERSQRRGDSRPPSAALESPLHPLARQTFVPLPNDFAAATPPHVGLGDDVAEEEEDATMNILASPL